MPPDQHETPTLPTTTGLSEPELMMARWLLHPWGPTQQIGVSLGIASWATSLGLLVRLPDRRTIPPRVRLSPAKLSAPTSVEKFAEWSRGLVGRLESPRGFASGSLISGDGLVLTCAHCLEHEPTQMRFSEGNWAGTYPIEVVFVNAEADVALIRAVGLRTPRWFNVRTDQAARKGEAIVAIGYMSLAGGSASTEAGITAGIVADPEVEYSGIPTLIADVAMASGSSGGPLISMQTGEVIGVVTMVMAGGIFKERGQSGTVCGAAPAERLPLTLGLIK